MRCLEMRSWRHILKVGTAIACSLVIAGSSFAFDGKGGGKSGGGGGGGGQRSAQTDRGGARGGQRSAAQSNQRPSRSANRASNNNNHQRREAPRPNVQRESQRQRAAGDARRESPRPKTAPAARNDQRRQAEQSAQRAMAERRAVAEQTQRNVQRQERARQEQGRTVERGKTRPEAANRPRERQAQPKPSASNKGAIDRPAFNRPESTQSGKGSPAVKSSSGSKGSVKPKANNASKPKTRTIDIKPRTKSSGNKPSAGQPNQPKVTTSKGASNPKPGLGKPNSPKNPVVKKSNSGSKPKTISSKPKSGSSSKSAGLKPAALAGKNPTVEAFNRPQTKHGEGKTVRRDFFDRGDRDHDRDRKHSVRDRDDDDRHHRSFSSPRHRSVRHSSCGHGICHGRPVCVYVRDYCDPVVIPAHGFHSRPRYCDDYDDRFFFGYGSRHVSISFAFGHYRNRWHEYYGHRRWYGYASHYDPCYDPCYDRYWDPCDPCPPVYTCYRPRVVVYRYGYYRPRYRCYEPIYRTSYGSYSYSWLNDEPDYVDSYTSYDSSDSYDSSPTWLANAPSASESSSSDAANDDGWDLLLAGDAREARRAFERAINADPSDGLPHIGYAIAAANLDRYAEAVASMRTALRNDPDSLSETPSLEAVAVLISTALEHYREQTRQSPDDLDALFMTAALRSLLGEQALAYFAIDTAIEQGDDDLSAANLKAVIQASMAEEIDPEPVDPTSDPAPPDDAEEPENLNPGAIY